MNIELLKAYNDILHRRFCSVKVISVPRDGDPYDMKYCALGIADRERDVFMDFVFDNLAPQLRDLGFDFEGIAPYSIEETARLFPTVWAEIQIAAVKEFVSGKVDVWTPAAAVSIPPVPSPQPSGWCHPQLDMVLVLLKQKTIALTRVNESGENGQLPVLESCFAA